MRHLDHLQLVDALDHSGADVEAHLQTCAACRAELDELRASLASVRRDLPPEPSPLFWSSFAARVNAGIDADAKVAPAASAGGWMPHALAWSGVLALVLAVVSIIVAPKRPADAPTVAVEQAVMLPETDVVEDEAWAVLRGLAEDFDYDEAREAGVAPRDGAVDRVALELNDAERAELARIIDAELKRIGP
jgi:hypothetical protein